MKPLTLPLIILCSLLWFGAKASIPILRPRPLCFSQIALANQACSLLPTQHPDDEHTDTAMPQIFTNSPPDEYQNDDEGEDDDDEEDNGDEQQRGGGHHGGDGSEGGTGEQGRGGHGSGSGSGSRRRGHRSRRNREHHHHHHETSETSECCKWLKEVDASCVCNLLIRLPTFLRRQTHAIVVKVHDACDVTYECQGRL